MTWVPDACTLPTAEQPVRVAEFDELFARTVHAVRRTGPTTLELELAADSRAELDDLVARETACCSFFTFTIVDREDSLLLTVEVPAARTVVLDGLADRVTA